MTYVPTVNLTPLYSFAQYTSGGGTAGLQTALNALPTVTSGTVQVFADAQASGNALVVFNEAQVFSVPQNSWVGFNQGTWTQYPNAKFTTTFTSYP
ncbi:MAG TPA: hypothetical protein VH084_21990 [Mycobacterium sp.]|nr:hypothetical protein [Mycobacterium sp.]